MLSRRQFLTAAAAIGTSLTTGSTLSAANGIYCPILMYHYVTPIPETANGYLRGLIVPPELFTEHVAWLQGEGFQSISMAHLAAALFQGAPLPPKPIVFTFDDGYIDAYQFAMPILAQHGMVGTFYVVSSFMDQPGYLGWGHAAEMQNAGMEIGNHSASHIRLSGQSRDVQFEEIEGGAARIADVLGIRPVSFCYPLGRFDRNTMNIAQETGHATAATTSDGTIHYASNPYRLRRVRIRNTTNLRSLEWLVSRRF